MSYWASLQRNRELGSPLQRTNTDAGLFSPTIIQDIEAEAAASIFKEKTGQDILPEGSPGYLLQRMQAYRVFEENKKEIKALAAEATQGVRGMQFQRTINQTGGMRNGMARNPFNMNMLRGPQMNERPKHVPGTPIDQTGGRRDVYNTQISPYIEERLPREI